MLLVTSRWSTSLRSITMSNQPQPVEKTLYTAVATATSGREGRAKTDDGLLDVALVPPKSMGGCPGA